MDSQTCLFFVFRTQYDDDDDIFGQTQPTEWINFKQFYLMLSVTTSLDAHVRSACLVANNVC